MEYYKYSLANRGKYHCPECGRKTFVLYIDNRTNKPLHSTVGKCDRSDNCGNHYTPKQYFQDNNISFDKSSYTPQTKPTPKPKPQSSFIDTDKFKESLQGYEKNNFIQYLYSIFPVEVVDNAISLYSVGTSKNGGIVFWQIDLQSKIRTGKIIVYDMNGHRRKDIQPPIQWVHRQFKLSNYNLSQCLFGEHLLHDTTKKVAIVESEKTAIIASVYLPQFIWLACGGSEGLNIEKCQCLKGRNVVLFPDVKMFDKWKAISNKLTEICNVFVSDLIEKKATETECKAGFDLADYLIKIPYKEPEKQFEPQPIQIPQPINKSVTEQETAEKESCNDEVLPIESETVNFENDIIELKAFFSNAILPTKPIKLNSWTTINDVSLFIDTHITALTNCNTNRLILPYLKRLQEFKTVLNSDNFSNFANI